MASQLLGRDGMIGEIERLVKSIRGGDLEAVRRLLMILSSLVPPGIDNMIHLVDKEQYSLYLSSEGLKTVMVARGEFLPFIESHVAKMSFERLSDEDLEKIGGRIGEILGELRVNLGKWLEYDLEDSPLYEKALEYVEWYDSVGKSL